MKPPAPHTSTVMSLLGIFRSLDDKNFCACVLVSSGSFSSPIALKTARAKSPINSTSGESWSRWFRAQNLRGNLFEI